MTYSYTPQYLKYPLICIQILLFIFVIISNYLLWIYLKKTQSPSTLFIKTIIIASIPAVGIGHLLFTIIYIKDNHLGNIDVCNILLVIIYALYLSPCISIIHVTALMIYHRYLIITNKNTLKIKTNIKTAILMVLLYSMILECFVIYEIYVLYITSNSVTICKIAYQVKYEKCIFKTVLTPCFTPLTVIIIAISITLTSFIVAISSKKSKQHIKNEMKIIERSLGVKQTMNFKRIKASNYLWISFTLFWLPWGLTRLSFSVSSNAVITQIISDVFQTLSLTIYFTLPLVYYHMDSNFNKFVRKLFPSKKVKPLINGNSRETNVNIAHAHYSTTNPCIILRETQPDNGVILPTTTNEIIKVVPCTANKETTT